MFSKKYLTLAGATLISANLLSSCIIAVGNSDKKLIDQQRLSQREHAMSPTLGKTLYRSLDTKIG